MRSYITSDMKYAIDLNGMEEGKSYKVFVEYKHKGKWVTKCPPKCIECRAVIVIEDITTPKRSYHEIT